MNRYAPLYIGTAGQSDELTPELARSKAALIWQMTRLGLNVPPAFVLPTELCAPVNRNDPQALAALDQGLRDGIARLQEATGRRLRGDRARLLAKASLGAQSGGAIREFFRLTRESRAGRDFTAT